MSVLTGVTAFLSAEAASKDYVIAFDWAFIGGILEQLVNTAILVVALSWLLYEPVKKWLNNRTERIKNQLEQAERDSRSAKDLKEEYETKLVEIAKERDRELTAARQRGLERAESIMSDARREAEVIITRANLETKLEREKVRDDMKRQMVEVASLIAAKYIDEKMDDATQARLLDSALTSMEAQAW